MRAVRLNTAKQAAIWRWKFGSQFDLSVHGATMIARGIVQPDALCRSYDVEFRITSGIPKVTIVEPELHVAPDDLANTHMYRTQEPCLFRPHTHDWRPKFVRFTILVTWLQEWIIFHEIWKATGVWLGGGEHPYTDAGTS